MKRLSSLLALLLLTFPVSAQEEEFARLSYYGEISVPAMDRSQIYRCTDGWEKDNRDNFGLGTSTINFDSPDRERRLVGSVYATLGFLNEYHFVFCVYITATDGVCSVELTDIIADMNGWDFTKGLYMPENKAGVSKIFGLSNLRYYKKSCKWLQSYFDNLMDSLAEYLTSE